jgi:hypothetical protein
MLSFYASERSPRIKATVSLPNSPTLKERFATEQPSTASVSTVLRISSNAF